jgi:hypothetical protein
MPITPEQARAELQRRAQAELARRGVEVPKPTIQQAAAKAVADQAAGVPLPVGPTQDFVAGKSQSLQLPEIKQLPDDTWLADRYKALKGGLLRAEAAVPGRLAGMMSAAKATSGLSPYSAVAEQVIGEQTAGDIKALRARAKDLYIKAEKVESTRGERGPVGWVADLALGSLPQIGAAALASAGGGSLGVVAVAGGIGGEEVYQNLRELGVDENKAEAAAWVTAPIIGLLEKLQLDEALKVSNKAALKELVTAARQKAFKKLAKAGGKITVNELIHAGTGGLQEALQEATSIGAEVALARDFDLKKDFTRVAGAFAGGTVLEGVFRAGRAGAQGIGSVVQENRKQSNVDFLRRQQLSPPSVTEPIEATNPAPAESPAETAVPIGAEPDAKVDETVSEPPAVPMKEDMTPSPGDTPDQISFRNADLETRRAELGLSPVAETQPRGTLQERMQAAVDAGMADVNAARHIAADILSNGRMATDLETHGLHLANQQLNQQVENLEQQLVDFDADSADFKAASEAHDAVLHDLDLITRVGIETGTMWSHIGWARQALVGDNGNYVGVLARAKKRAGRNLTPAEETKLRGKVTDYRKQQRRAKEATTKDAEVRTRKYLQRHTKKRKKGQKLSKLGKLTKMTTEEKDAQLNDLLSRELTEVTLTDIFMNLASRQENPSIDTTVQMVRQYLPDVTHTQIVDAFDQAGRRKARNTSAMEQSLKWLRGQVKKEKGKLVTIDDILYWFNEGRLPDETEPSLDLDDKVVRDLQEVVEQAKKLQKDSEPYIQRKLEKQIQFLTARLAAKDFGNKKADFAFKPSRYTLELQYQSAKLSAEIGRNVAQMKPAGLVKRVVSGTTQSIQALKSSFDNSGLLNQGGFVAFAHPIRALKTLPKALAAATSDRRAFMIEQEILSRPNAPLYSRYGVGLTRATEASTFTEREEEFRESLAEYIPGIRASNRMFATTLNILRADSFDAMAGGKDAIALGLSDVEGQAIADFVNITTGRGNIRGHESTVHALNGILWAPRRFISRFQMFATLGGQIEYGFKKGQSKWRPEVHLRGTAAVRKAMAWEVARYLMSLSATMFLAGLAGAEFEWDPRSSDFLKLRWGNLRLDPLSGFSQTLVIASRLGTLKTKPVDGVVEDLSGYDADRLAQRFFRYKLSPAFGIAWSMLTEQTPFDGPLEEGRWSLATAGWAAKEAVVPISVEDIFKAAADQGIPRAAIFSTLGLLGAGVQVYGDTPYSSGPRRIYRAGAL